MSTPGRRKVIDGLTLPVPSEGTIARAIVSGMKGWKKAAEVITRVSPDITQNSRSVRQAINKLIKDGYLTRKSNQRIALTYHGCQARDYINSPREESPRDTHPELARVVKALEKLFPQSKIGVRMLPLQPLSPEQQRIQRMRLRQIPRRYI